MAGLNRLAKEVPIVAVSADSPAESVAYAEEQFIAFPLLSDPKLVAITAWGVRMEGGDIAVPATFVVRKDGRIQWRYVGETQADFATDETIRAALVEARR